MWKRGVAFCPYARISVPASKVNRMPERDGGLQGFPGCGTMRLTEKLEERTDADAKKGPSGGAHGAAERPAH